MLLEMLRYQGSQQVQPICRQATLFAQDVAERLSFIEQPRVHGRDQGIFRDEIQLHGEDTEQQIAIGRRRHGRAPLRRQWEFGNSRQV
jgi:hypothetical protein